MERKGKWEASLDEGQGLELHGAPHVTNAFCNSGTEVIKSFKKQRGNGDPQ